MLADQRTTRSRALALTALWFRASACASFSRSLAAQRPLLAAHSMATAHTVRKYGTAVTDSFARAPLFSLADALRFCGEHSPPAVRPYFDEDGHISPARYVDHADSLTIRFTLVSIHSTTDRLVELTFCGGALARASCSCPHGYVPPEL